MVNISIELPPEQPKQPQSQTQWIPIILGLLLLGFVGFIIYQKSNKSHDVPVQRYEPPQPPPPPQPIIIQKQSDETESKLSKLQRQLDDIALRQQEKEFVVKKEQTLNSIGKEEKIRKLASDLQVLEQRKRELNRERQAQSMQSQPREKINLSKEDIEKLYDGFENIGR